MLDICSEFSFLVENLNYSYVCAMLTILFHFPFSSYWDGILWSGFGQALLCYFSHASGGKVDRLHSNTYLFNAFLFHAQVPANSSYF